MKKKNYNVAIIPARLNSERIPKKNIKMFFGKPMIAWSIKVAIDSNLFDRVIVSTDSKKIAKIANRYGAETPFLRPKKLSDNITPINEVANHAILHVQENEKIKIDYACIIFATAPFLKKKYLIEGYERLKNNSQNYCVSIAEYSFPIERALRKNKMNKIKIIEKNNYLRRSQDFKKSFHEAGQFIWGKAKAFTKKLSSYEKSIGVVIPNHLVQDIDNLSDWKISEIKFKILEKMELF